MNCSYAVKSVWSVRRPCVALAIPKSITLGSRTSSFTVTRMFDGLRDCAFESVVKVQTMQEAGAACQGAVDLWPIGCDWALGDY
jgi:hypothetical protein